jgi:two-component system, OmpR family, KDP operon response regulator KdpE
MAANLPRLLLVDASETSRTMLVAGLTGLHFAIEEATSAAAALQRLAGERADIVLLDFDLPDAGGLDLISGIRRRWPIPLVVLSAKPTEDGLLEAFERGADDYVGKPVNFPKLAARLRAALRHRFRAREATPLLHYGEIAIDPLNRRVTRAGRDVKLSPTEYDILTLLAEHAGKILTHDYLLRRVWGPDKINDIQYLRVYVRALRRKLGEPDARREMIRTESGVGYRFVPVTTRPGESCQSAA